MILAVNVGNSSTAFGICRDGYVGIVEALVDRIKAELPGKVRVLATGGQADVVIPHTGRIYTVEPWLHLEGLRLISERNPLR